MASTYGGFLRCKSVVRHDIIARIQQFRMGIPNVLGLRAAIASLQDNAEKKIFVPGVLYLSTLGQDVQTAHSQTKIEQGPAPVQ
jgi:hypothetical protein